MGPGFCLLIMKKILVTVEMELAEAGQRKLLCGQIRRVGDTSSAELFEVNVSSDSRELVNEQIAASDLALAKLRLREHMRRFLDKCDPNRVSVNVLADSHQLLPLRTYRCTNPECGAKLFESWGPAQGITIVCRKCKGKCVPTASTRGDSDGV